ncbi:MAG: tetratricopeptide repeat protein, partial [Myxococcota bacterium]|nr:tetratricopeptide repeat protein [Myxococcota bacterium]
MEEWVSEKADFDFRSLYERLSDVLSGEKLTEHERRKLIELVEGARSKQSDHFESLRARFFELNSIDQIEEALAAGLSGLALNPASIELRLEVAWLMLERGELDAARALAYPKKQGGILLGEGRKDEAQLLSLRAEIFLYVNDYAKATRHATLAYELEPECPWVLTALSQVYHWRGQHQEQKQYLQRALAISPMHPIALSRWLLRPDSSYHPALRLREARRAYHRAPQVRGFQHGYCYALALMGQLDEAVKLAEELVARNPIAPCARLIYAFVLCRQSYKKEGLREIERALERAPTSPAARLICACLLASLGRREEAQVHLAWLEDLAPSSPRVALWYSEALRAARQPERAEQQLLRLVKSWPRQVDFRYALAALLTRRGDYEAAQRHCDEILERAPEHLSAQLLDLDLCLTFQSVERAQSRLEVLRGHPDAIESELRLHMMQRCFSEAIVLARQQRQLQPRRLEWAEYEIIALWQSEKEISTALEQIDRELDLVGSRSATINILLSYLFLHVDERARARTLLQESFLDFRSELSRLRLQRLLFAAEVAEQLEEPSILEQTVTLLERRAPEHPMSLYYQALMRWDQGAHDEALSALEIAIEESHEEQQRFFILLGHWRCELGEYAFAVTAYRHALQLAEEGEELELFGWLGYANLRAGYLESARLCFDHYDIDLERRCAAARWYLQYCHEAQEVSGQREESIFDPSVVVRALAEAERWLTLAKKSAKADGLHGVSLGELAQLWSELAFLQGQELAGIAYLEEAISLREEPEWLWLLAQHQERRGELLAAARSFERADQLLSGTHLITVERALFLLRSERAGDALRLVT